MGAKPQFLVVLGDDQWKVVRTTRRGEDCSESQTMDRKELRECAPRIHATLTEMGYGGQPLLLALGSSWCVSVSLDIPTARHGRKREALTYLLEPYLPWAAEEIVADYEIRGTKALAVATLAEPLSQLIACLEELGVRVESIAPAARLAVEQYLSKTARMPERYALVCGNGSTTDIWLIENDRPRAWQWVPQEPPAIVRSLEGFRGADPAPLAVVTCHVISNIVTMINESPDFESKDSAAAAAEPLAAAAQFAVNVLEGAKGAPIELRRDLLASTHRSQSLGRAIGAFQLALILVLCTTAAMIYLRGEQYDAIRRATAESQSDAFRKLFPDAPVPVGVRSRLESEYSRLAGVRGDHQDLPETMPGVVLIERLLRSLPSDMRYRILEVRIENGRLQIVGQVREHSEADRIADALRKTKLVVDPPKTHKLQEKGVEFRISARIPDSTPPKKTI